MDKTDSILACDYFCKPISSQLEKDIKYPSLNEKTPNKNSSAHKNSTSKKDVLYTSNGNANKSDQNINAEFICFSTINKNIYFLNLDEKNNFVNENIPNPNSLITQIKFKDEKNIILVSEDNKFYLINFEIYTGLKRDSYDKIVDVNFKFSEWTQKNISNFPINYKKWYNKIMGVSFNNFQKNLIILYTDYNYIIIDLEKEIPKYSLIEKIKEEKYRNVDWTKSLKDYHKKIYERNYKNIEKDLGDYKEFDGNIDDFEKDKNDNFKIVSRFSSILYMNVFENPYSSDKSLLFVVENDWNKITKNFREAVTKSNYAN